MEKDEKTIGENLRKLRGNISQEELAGRMRTLGYPWTKMTVYNVEKGERQLRLSEAKAALIALDANVDTGLVSLFDTGDSYMVGLIINQVKSYQAKLEECAVEFYHSRESLESQKYTYIRQGDSKSQALLTQIEGALDDSDYAFVVARIRMIFGGQSDDMGVVVVDSDDEPLKS